MRPLGVLINDQLQILQFRGPSGAFLQPPTGKASFDILKMAREGLMMPLGAAINGGGSTTDVTDTDISDNAAGIGGGVSSNSGVTSLTGDILTGNIGGLSGGGGASTGGTTTVSGAIVTGNYAIYGGGLYNNGALSVGGCTVSGNSAAGGAPDISGAIVSQGNSQVGDTDGSTGGRARICMWRASAV